MNCYLRNLAGRVTRYLALKSEMVEHREVVHEIASSVDRSWVYYTTLVLASLIALLGLLTNSVAVVIGAMLISPLMGPIISSSLALTIGDLPLARRAFKTIAASVALTILISAAVTLLSPLKEPTAEILARVRPNILDLFVAVLSGTVGAIALCTKRNYLITSTGVAVATAVIPPLSVTGYALGTWQPMLAIGGFLLFFTNFVAIILACDLVFFILGFRTSLVQTATYSRRTRYLIVSGLLTLISIPLVYTLAVDLARVKEKKRIERVLKRHLNKEEASRLTGYERRLNGDRVRISVSVNTVEYIDRESERSIEQDLSKELKLPVEIHLEQVVVASVLKQQQPSGFMAGGAAPASRQESPAQLAARLQAMAARVENELADALSPFPLHDTRLTFAAAGKPLQVSAALRRDYPVSRDELLILSRQLERALEIPVTLSIATAPLLPPLRVARDGSLATQSMRDLDIVARLPGGPGGFSFRISNRPGRGKEARALKQYLTNKLAVPERLLSLVQGHTAVPPAAVVLRIVRQ